MANEKDNKHYISRSESRKIAKENSKAIRYYEKQKKRKAKPDDYTCQLTAFNEIIDLSQVEALAFQSDWENDATGKPSIPVYEYIPVS